MSGASGKWRQGLAVGAIAVGVGLGGAGAALAETVHVAVAANFTVPAEKIAAAFEAETGHEVLLSFGATGALYTQIAQGAPFEVFLAADRARPEKAVAEGYGVEDTVFTYAIGKLVLLSTVFDVSDGAAVLAAGEFDRLSIAEPAAAPYGAAAVEALHSLGLYEGLVDKIVTGANVTQALQFIETGNAELGFVALSQVPGRAAKEVWVVPEDLYAPILQGAVLLNSGAHNAAAEAFIAYLKGAARAVIEDSGYGFPQE